jgi:sugar lactone lactonase YvrE
MNIECLYDQRQMLAEGPLWYQSYLYWVDIKAQTLHRMDVRQGIHQQRQFDAGITSISIRAMGGFVVTTRRGFALLADFDAPLTLLGEVEPELPGNRFNDAKVDPYGHLWAGTMDDAETTTCGSLYRLDAAQHWLQSDTNYRITNGPAFSPDGGTLYHTDSVTKQIYAFDLTAQGISNKRLFIALDADHGHPDGMTVDAAGHLWVCEYAGWGVSEFSSQGEFLRKLALPVANVTSCCFGGDDYDTLFMTTAAKDLSELDLASQPLAGSIFSTKPGAIGIAAFAYQG